MAQVVSGSGKQLQVACDNSKSAINMLSGQTFTVVGGELAKGDGKTKTARASISTIFRYGTILNLAAYTIGCNNYFKLRDLGQTFDFNVSWDAANNAAVINTKARYTAD